jgi:hypothetical protein
MRFLWLLLPIWAGLSQPTPQPAFEVASVKPSPPPNGDALYINLGRRVTVQSGWPTLRWASASSGRTIW